MKTDNIDIRRAKENDAKVLSQLIRSAHKGVATKFGLTKENCPKHPSNCSIDWIQADFNREVLYFILTENHLPVGCVAVKKANPQVCYLERLSVIEAYRKKGYGAHLVRHAIKTAQALDAHTISIGIIAQFDILKQWYRHLGFKETQTLDIKHLPFKVLMMEYSMMKTDKEAC